MQVTDEMVQDAVEAYAANDPDETLLDGPAMRAALSAALAGHVVVPREPTYEMGEAGIASLGEDDDRQPSQLVWDVYRAMIDAASPVSRGE